jgi:hypothetical protein
MFKAAKTVNPSPSFIALLVSVGLFLCIMGALIIVNPLAFGHLNAYLCVKFL